MPPVSTDVTTSARAEPSATALGRPFAAAFSAVARLRSGPAIHKFGTTYRARLDVVEQADGASEQAPIAGRSDLFVPGPPREALVRLSRSAGFPTSLPDVLGLAIRLEGEAKPQDLLLDSCGPGPLGRHAVRFGRDVRRGPYGTLIAYRAGGSLLHIAAFGEDSFADGPIAHDAAAGTRFRLAVAAPFEGTWRPWARLTLLESVPQPTLRFSPANDGLGLSMRRDWAAFRHPSYRSSQRSGPRQAEPGAGKLGGPSSRPERASLSR